MYIAPNTDIRILKNVRLDNTYEHTIYFTSAVSQSNYFNSKSKHRLEKQTYQMVQNKIRVNISNDDLFDCNYLMFRNTAYGNKWFYGFIVQTEYINNGVSHITFEIDVIQTWLMDFNFNPTFIEREMSLTDNIGDNLVPENLELGEYKYTDLGLTSLFNLYQVVIAATFDKNLQPSVGGMYGGVYSGLCYNVFSSFSEANTFLEEVGSQGKADGIVSIFMLPIAFCYDFQDTMPEAYLIERDKNYSYIDGFIPNNKKLFTYPYNMLYVTDNEGNFANFRFEDFNTTKCNFEVAGCMSCVPEVALIPYFYKGVDTNYNEMLTMGNFPQCGYTVDTFKAYVAQNTIKLGTDLATSVAQTAVGAITMKASGGLMGAGQVVGGLTGILGTLASLGDKTTLPQQARGSHSSSINMAKQIKGFQFYYAYIKREFAVIIDNFFDLYGYATNTVKIPNLNSRPHWNYVKTQNCNIYGNIPVTHLSKIKTIFNNGITLWKNGDNIGNYTLDNRA